jgi:hypothetical protein
MAGASSSEMQHKLFGFAIRKVLRSSLRIRKAFRSISKSVLAQDVQRQWCGHCSVSVKAIDQRASNAGTVSG